jgi:D-alanyl-D-alanine carboxypeptidase
MESVVGTRGIGYKDLVKTRSLRGSREHRRHGCRQEVVLALVFIFGVGFSLSGFGEEAMAAPIEHSTPASEWSLLFYSDTTSSPAREDEASAGQRTKSKTRKLLGSAATCDDLGVLVHPSHSLPSDYVPPDLVRLQDYGVPTLGSEVLRRGAAEHLGGLVEDATADGEELVVASAYRSYHEQRLSHQRLTSVFGTGADRTSATPGHSQHQLGTTVDFTNAAAGYQLWVPFARTSAHRWLEQHAWEYGFVLAYPLGKEEETGYKWEPWHYRYVGVENARRIEESDLSLQEFLERSGTTPHC